MHTEDKDKKFRRWPPRVRRRRSTTEQAATPTREPEEKPLQTPADTPTAEATTKHTDGAGRNVKVKFRTRRRVVRPPSDSQD